MSDKIKDYITDYITAEHLSDGQTIDLLTELVEWCNEGIETLKIMGE